MMKTTMLKPAEFIRLTTVLREHLGEAADLHTLSPLSYCNSPLEVLVATILTQATSDRNSLRVWRDLKARFSMEDVAEMSEAELETVLRPGGLALQKARSIQAVLRSIRQQLGELALDRVPLDAREMMAFLKGLPGVGPKTAACVIRFGFNLPAFPVDLHVARIARRMGWVEPKLAPDKIQAILTATVPAELHGDLHILLLNLGRRYCRPHSPNCAGCPANGFCRQIIQ